MATPAPAPSVVPMTVAPATPEPGWKTSEAWLAYLVVLLNGLISSGLIVETSQVGKIVSLGIMALTYLGYGTHRTLLKIAHVNAANDNAPAAPRAAQAGFVTVHVMMIVALIATLFVAFGGCSGSGQKIKQDVTIAADSAIDCLKLEAAAIKKGEGWIGFALSISEQLGATLVTGGDPLALVASLVSQYTQPVVSCVMREIAMGGPPKAAGSGSAGPSTAAKTPKQIAAEKIIAKHGWSYK